MLEQSIEVRSGLREDRRVRRCNKTCAPSLTRPIYSLYHSVLNHRRADAERTFVWRARYAPDIAVGMGGNAGVAGGIALTAQYRSGELLSEDVALGANLGWIHDALNWDLIECYMPKDRAWEEKIESAARNNGGGHFQGKTTE